MWTVRFQCCVYAYSSAENCIVSSSFDDVTFLSSKNHTSPSVSAFLKLLHQNFLPDLDLDLTLPAGCFHFIFMFKIFVILFSFIHYNSPISSYSVINLSSSICIFLFFVIFIFYILFWLHSLSIYKLYIYIVYIY